MRIRRATCADANTLAALLADYLQESYPGHIGSTPEQLQRDVFGEHPQHHVLLAEIGQQIVAFVAWDAVYDMHWALGGAQVADLYVAPRNRGFGVALMLLVRLAAEMQAAGGAFLRGGAYDCESTRRFYGRVAVVAPSGETHLSGRAFRHVAQLAGQSVRDVLRALPPIAWNFES